MVSAHPRRRPHGDHGSGYVPALVGILVALAALELIVSLARLAAAQVRLSATAQDVARLAAGALGTSGRMPWAAIAAQERADLGSLAQGATLSLRPRDGEVVARVSTRLPIASIPGVAPLETTMVGRAAIAAEPA